MTKKLNANLIKIIQILSDGKYHDGTSIGEQLQMTRSAVWKIIKKLVAYHIKIDSIKGRGYALLEPLVLLESAKIKKALNHNKIDIAVYESLPSTNAYLKQQKHFHANEIKICLAEQQTHGKGRLNRDWFSPFARNIYLSCLYPFQKDISELAGLSLVTSLAIVKTLKHYGIHEKLNVKWPNDIIYDNKKLSGGLIEIHAESHGCSYAIIGIGVNTNMLEDERQINQPWTSVQKILGRYLDRNELVACLINNLLNYLNEFNQSGFQNFIKEWIQADCLTHQVISVKNLNEIITGKVTGINSQGHLLLELSDGTVRAFSSGDTSIVKKTLAISFLND